MRINPLLLVILICSLLLTQGCKKETTTEPSKPKLPPTNVFLHAFDNLEIELDSADSNFQYAQDKMGEWNSFFTSGLEIPLRAWKEIRDKEPYWEDLESAWIWNAEFNDIDGNYTANLHGWVDEKDKEFKWRMYISYQGFFEDFLWFTGHSRKDSASGYWRIYESYTIDKPYIDITWRNREKSELDTLIITKESPYDLNAGSMFAIGEYENEEDEVEVFVNITEVKSGDNTYILLNEEQEWGSISAPHYFGDPAVRCWNAIGANINCSGL